MVTSRRLLVTDEDPPPDELLLTGEVPAYLSLGTGTEPPVPEWVEFSQSLERYFAFIDVCGFTAYTDRHGTRAAIELLTRFRAVCREVAVRRGVRVAKWLGDGVMLVGTEPGPVIATAAELLLRCGAESFDIHGGVAGGVVLLFEGDDHIGRPVNLAARLCDAASPGEVLCSGLDANIPEWVDVVGHLTLDVVGMGELTGVSQLRVHDDAWQTGRPVTHSVAS